MHRKNCVPRTVFWIVVLGLVFGSALADTEAAEEPMRTPVLIVPINGTRPLHLSTPKVNLKQVLNQDPNVAKVAPLHDDLSGVMITGLKVGITRVTLVDEKGGREVVDVVVQPDV